MNISRFLAMIACILFVLSALGINSGHIALLPLGLAFLAGSHVV